MSLTGEKRKNPYEDIGDAFSECLSADLRLHFSDQFDQMCDLDNWVNNVLYWHPGLPLPTDSFIDHYQEHRAAFTLPCIVDMSKDDYAFELQRSTDHFQLLCEKSVITTEKIVKIAKLALKNVDSYMGDAWIGDPSIISDYKQRLGRLATK